MNYPLLTCFSLLLFCSFCTLVLSQNPTPAPGVIDYYRNQTILATNPKQYTNSFSLSTGGILYFTTVPCFGEYDWYIGYDYPPNASLWTAYYPWTSDGASRTWIINSTFPATIYFLYQGLNTHGSLSALFDILVYDTLSVGNAEIPSLPNSGKVSGSVGTGGKSGKVTWQPTGNSLDNYTVYWRYGEFPENGYTPFTACAVRLWMSTFTSSQGSVSHNSDGSYTVNADNLNPSQPFSVTVVVDRAGGYSAAYDSYAINNAWSLSPSMLFLAVSTLFMFVGVLM